MTRSRFVLSLVIVAALIGGPAALVGAQSDKSLPERVQALRSAMTGALAEIAAMALQVDTLFGLLGAHDGRLTSLEQTTRDAAVDVDCSAGQSVNQALAVNDGVLGWLRITIHGTCHESILIVHNRTSLLAAQPGDGITSFNQQNSAVRVAASHDVVLQGLTLQGGMQGLKLTLDASVRVTNCVITGNGIQGVQVDSGFVSLAATTVSNNPAGVVVFGGGRARISASTISNNSVMGLQVYSGGSALLDASTNVTGNHGGVVVWGGDFNMRAAVVQNNSGDGVQGVLGARIVLEPQSLIQNNGGNGLRLGDTAVAGLVGTMHVVNNGGWGVLCVGSPAIAQYVAGPGVVTGNLAGQISCPTSTIFPIGG